MTKAQCVAATARCVHQLSAEVHTLQRTLAADMRDIVVGGLITGIILWLAIGLAASHFNHRSHHEEDSKLPAALRMPRR